MEAPTLFTATKPVAPVVVVDSIPDQLKALPRWVGWRYELRGDKWQKPPICCGTGRRADLTDPATWTTFDQAIAAYLNLKRRNVAGVGFVFSDDDPYSGVDLDHCLDPASGMLEPWAEEIVREVRSYAEISPSGGGVKIIVRGKLPLASKTRKGNIEMYSRGRYFTVTGHHLTGTPPTVEARQEALQSLYSRVFGEVGAKGRPA